MTRNTGVQRGGGGDRARNKGLPCSLSLSRTEGTGGSLAAVGDCMIVTPVHIFVYCVFII